MKQTGFMMHADGKAFGPYRYAAGFQMGESGIVYQVVETPNGSKTNKLILAIKGPYVVEYSYGER